MHVWWRNKINMYQNPEWYNYGTWLNRKLIDVLYCVLYNRLASPITIFGPVDVISSIYRPA